LGIANCNGSFLQYTPRRLSRPPRARRRLVAARRASVPRAHQPPPVALHLDLEPAPQFAPKPTGRVDESRGLAADLVEAARATTRRAGELALPERGAGSLPHAARAPLAPASHLQRPLTLISSPRPNSRPSPQAESASCAASPPISSQSRAPLHAAPASSPSASAASARCRPPSERPSRSQATASGTTPRSRVRAPIRAQAQDRTGGSRSLAADLAKAVLAATGRAGKLALRERGVGSLPHGARAPLAPASHLQWHFISVSARAPVRAQAHRPSRRIARPRRRSRRSRARRFRLRRRSRPLRARRRLVR